MQQPIIETERLILRELLPTDVDGMFQLDSDPHVHTYLGNKPISSKQQAEDVIHFVRQQYIDNGIGRWAIVEKTTNTFIGWTGLKLVKEMTNKHINYYDLGYRLIRDYWGKGFATESASASLAYGFDTLKLNEVFAAADIENKGSNKVLKKLGFTQLEPFLYDNTTPHNWYKITQQEWKNTSNSIVLKQ
jgi:RimJ/RimL family protein N-acetyltransferase